MTSDAVNEPDDTIDRLIARYWKPIYCFIRYQGYDNKSAKDLTQGFFCDIVMPHDLFFQVKQAQGKFRTFLFQALKCYLGAQSGRFRVQKRLPKEGPQFPDYEYPNTIPSQSARPCPNEVFQCAWATDLVKQAIQATRQDYLGQGKELHWYVFLEKTLRPILEGGGAPSYGRICKKLENISEQQAQAMELRVRRRFGRILRGLLQG